MKELDAQLKSLKNKIQLLLKQNQLQLKENQELKKEVEALRASLNEKNDLLQHLHEQINALNNEEKKELEKRINLYLAEIEKCLTLLNA
jgi:chromosome segregation ATPase